MSVRTQARNPHTLTCMHVHVSIGTRAVMPTLSRHVCVHMRARPHRLARVCPEKHSRVDALRRTDGLREAQPGCQAQVPVLGQVPATSTHPAAQSPWGPWFGNRVLPNPVGCVAQWLWSHGVTMQGGFFWKNSMKTKLRILQTPPLANNQGLQPLFAHVPSPATSTYAEAWRRRRHSPSCKVEPGPAWKFLAL